MPGLNADVQDEGDEYDLSYDNYSFGFHSICDYNHSKKHTDILDILYNKCLRKFVLLDTRGFCTWSFQKEKLERQFTFPRYQNRLLRSMIYCEKHNVYFAICHDFTLEVFNKHFVSTCKTENVNLRSILHISYNPKTDELISAGTAGTTIWKYQLSNKVKFDQLQPKANYTLVQTSLFKNVGGSWCTKVVLLYQIQQVCFCSDNDVYVHSCKDLKLLFQLKKAHSASITCVGFCSVTKVLVTGSMDSEVKVWSSNGGHVYTFRGHSQPITALVINPDQSGLVTTSSQDGTVKVWSLHAMELFYSLNVFSSGIDWMNITNDNIVWCATEKKIVMYKFHTVATFWGHTRGPVAYLRMTEEPGKSNRVVSTGDDGSVRIFSSTSKDTLALCTALPPPISTSADCAPSVAYSRIKNLIFVLITPQKIWVYTSKTDPACRIAEWNLSKIYRPPTSDSTSSTFLRSKKLLTKPVLHKALANLNGFDISYKCKCLLAIYSPNGFQFSDTLGLCSAITKNMLLLGLQDGRIVFADQMNKGVKYFEIATSKEPVHSMKYDHTKSCLYTCTGTSSSSDIRVWSLPTLHHVVKVSRIPDLTAFLIFEDYSVCGHKNGMVEINKLNYTTPTAVAPEQESQPAIVTFRYSPRDPTAHQLYHKSRVVDIQACISRRVFASCSNDGAIKIWSYDKALLTEIWLDGSLSCCLFLNSHADLLVGWKSHIYLINRLTVLSQLNESSSESEAAQEESVIYEDPGNRYHDLVDTKEELDLDQYLVPYEFVLKETKDTNVVHVPDPQHVEERSPTPPEVEYVHAPTELYRSPPESLCSACDFDAFGKLVNHNNWVFPEFGESPIPTPPVSSEASEKDEEEQEEQVEYVEDDDDAITPREKSVEKVKSIHKAASESFEKSEDNVPEEVESENLSEEEEMVVVDVEEIVHDAEDVSPAVEETIEPEQSVVKIENLVVKAQKKVEKPPAPEEEKIVEQKQSTPQQPLQQLRRQRIMQQQQRTAPKITPRFKKYRRAPSGGKLQQQQTDATEASMTVKLDEDQVGTEKRKAEVVEYAHVVPKTITYGGEGKEICLSKNATTATQIPTKQVYKHTTYERPKISDALQAVGALKTLTIGGKTRAHLAGTRPANKHWKDRRPDITNEMSMTSIRSDSPSSNQGKNDMAEERKTVMEVYLTRKSLIGSERKKEKNNEVDNGDKIEEMKMVMRESTESNQRSAKISQSKKLPVRVGFRMTMSADQWDDPDRTDPHINEFERLDSFYKNDGLQLGDDWQERMLERYVFLKKQREYRQKSCAEKREILLRDRKYKILSHRPELSSDSFALYEDRDRLASHLLNSPLLSGEPDRICDVQPRKPPATPVAVCRPTQREASHPESRLPSAVLDIDDDHDDSEPPVGYRLSLWKPASAVFCPRKMSGRKSSLKSRCYSAPFRSSTPQLGSTTQRSATPSRLVVDRPRSSASIPGKTRYILVKTEDPSRKVKTPNKLETELLRQRFPVQHRAVLRAIKKLQMGMDDRESDWDYSGDLARHHLDEDSEPLQGVDNTSNNSHQPISISRKFHGDSAPTIGQKTSNISITTKRSVPSVSGCTSMEYNCPISVMHRKTSSYSPTSFRA